MSLLDLTVSYRPVVAVSTCTICGLPDPSYGAVVTSPPGAPLVGIDLGGTLLCHGHAIMVPSEPICACGRSYPECEAAPCADALAAEAYSVGPCDLGHPECEDHLHSQAYHSADCWCGKTEADCLVESL